jgi:AAA15 family ATPase/GTPase
MNNIFFKKLTIKNYKCFNKQEINFGVPDGKNEGSGLNFLIGENGTGKTTVLESINYLTQNTFSSENKLQINDFQNYEEEIEIECQTEPFKCKSSIDYYKEWFFEATGFEFHAKSRSTKARGKLLSSSFEIHNYFKVLGPYTKQDGTHPKDVDSRDKIYNNGNIIDGEINVFYFDKNRNRQIQTGNYKTIFEKICDDLNWKFLKNITDEVKEELVRNISGEYFKNVSNITQKGTGKKLALDLKEFFDEMEYANLKIDLLNLLHPFSNAFFAIRCENSLKQINIRDLGSGVEIILTLLLLRNIANESKGSIIYLIDEPELHLHPKAQEKLLELLLKESKDKQIFVSTHSPYLFKNSLSYDAHLYIFTKSKGGGINISNARDESWRILPWSPSWGEVNYKAYDLPTIEFHDELYGHLYEAYISSAKNEEEAKKRSYQKNFDTYLTTQFSLPLIKKWTPELAGLAQAEINCTLQTFIRNKAHHPENKIMQGANYSPEELRKSIDMMVNIIGIRKHHE